MPTPSLALSHTCSLFPSSTRAISFSLHPGYLLPSFTREAIVLLVRASFPDNRISQWNPARKLDWKPAERNEMKKKQRKKGRKTNRASLSHMAWLITTVEAVEQQLNNQLPSTLEADSHSISCAKVFYIFAKNVEPKRSRELKRKKNRILSYLISISLIWMCMVEIYVVSVEYASYLKGQTNMPHYLSSVLNGRKDTWIAWYSSHDVLLSNSF